MVSHSAGRKLCFALAGLLLFATSVAFAASYKAAFLTSDQNRHCAQHRSQLAECLGHQFQSHRAFLGLRQQHRKVDDL